MSKIKALLFAALLFTVLKSGATANPVSAELQQSTIVVDDVANRCDENRPSCYSDGDFVLSVDVEAPSISSVFHDSNSLDRTYNNHAYWAETYNPNFSFSTYGGIAEWRAYLPQSGRYFVEAYIPYVSTGRSNTQFAEYTVSTADGDETVYVNQNNQTGWVRLGEFYFNGRSTLNSTNSPMAARVVLPITTEDDPEEGRTIKFDAVQWIPVGGSSEPVTVNAYLQGYPDGTTFREGQQITHCYSVSEPVYIYWSYQHPQMGWQRIAEGYDNGKGDCDPSLPLQGVGERIVRIQALTGLGGTELARDDVRFSVVSGTVPTVTPVQPTPTRVIITPPVVPTQTPTPEAKTPVVILPGFGHTVPFTDKTRIGPISLIPNELMDLFVLIDDNRIPIKLCTYNWWESNATSAARLHECIREVGGRADRPVRIITHSNGGQVARSYIQDYPGAYPVSALYMIAPPNQGALSAYAIWAGGDLSLETEHNWIFKLAIGIDISCQLYGNSCIKDTVHSKIRSVHDLVPSNRPYLIDIRSNALGTSASYPNDWLEGLNTTASRLFDRVQKVVIHRGVGLQTPEMLRINPSKPGFNGLWPDGKPPFLNPVTKVTGDSTILAYRALIPGFTDASQYDIFDHFGVDHNAVIRQATNSILTDMGLDTGGIVPLQSPSENMPWAFIYAGDSYFQVTDSSGRSTGYGADGVQIQNIPDSEVISITDPPATLVLMSSVADEDYRLFLASNDFLNRQPYKLSILSGESAEFTFWETGVVDPGGIRDVSINPKQHRFSSLYLPIAAQRDPIVYRNDFCLSADREPNDTLSSVTNGASLCRNTGINASLSGSDRTDHFLLTAESEGMITVTKWDSPPGSSFELSLFTAAGQSLPATIADDQGLHRLVRRVASGSYVVRVSRSSGSIGGDYQIMWQLD